MKPPFKLFSALALATCLAAPVHAQNDPNIDTIVAVINGTNITLGHMIIARASLPEQYQQLPDEVLFNGILDQLIQQSALADQFEGDLPARVTLSLDNETRSLISSEVINQLLDEAPSEEELQTAYEAQYTNVEAEEEYNASHILVDTLEDAQTIKEELVNGADFAEMAREKSTGPSGPSGGSLGWFGKGMMVPAFEEAVIALTPGEVSVPVETQFGWHLILLNEVRKTEAPELEEVREELDLQIRQTRVQTAIERITASAEVDRSGAEDVDPAALKNLQWLE
ncbi:MAG: peptidylprolyl isomerase [Pseudomonadota bacterium]